MLFIGFDAIFVSSLTIWGTMIQFEDGAEGCRSSENNWVLLMYIFSICCLLYGWVYVILLLCGLTSLPLLGIFWCFYRKQLANMRGEMGVDNEQIRTNGNGADGQTHENINKVVSSLKKSLFAETNKKADSCVICMSKF